MPEAIVFDCDGVLVDSEDLSWGAWRTVLAGYGVTVTDEDVAALTGRTVEDCHARFSARAALPGVPDLGAEVGDAMFGVLEEHLQAFADAVDTLDVVVGRKRLAVASSSYRDRLDLSLHTTGLAHYFEASVAGDEVASGKPHPDLFEEAARRLGLDPSSCLAVEDSPTGIVAAAAAGMEVLAVDRGRFPIEALTEAGATAVVPRLTPAAVLR